MRPDRTARGFVSRHRYAVIGVVAVLAATVNAIVVRLPEGGTLLEIKHVEAKVGEEGALNVAVDIENPFGQATYGRVWWLLAPPGRGTEWDRRVYQSSIRAIEVPPDRSARLTWSEASPVPGGRYTVSAWVHVPGRNGYVHGDGRVATNLGLEIPTGTLLRARPPSSDLRIDDLNVTVPPDTSDALTAKVTVESSTGEARRAHVRLALSPASGAGDRNWWRVPPVWMSDLTEVDLAGPSAETIDISAPWPEAAAGQYAIRAMLVDLTPQREGPLDEVALPVPVSTLAQGPVCAGGTFCVPGAYNPLQLTRP